MELGLLQPISSGDQILLYGPPFKTFDSQVGPRIAHSMTVPTALHMPAVLHSIDRTWSWTTSAFSYSTAASSPMRVSAPTFGPDPLRNRLNQSQSQVSRPWPYSNGHSALTHGVWCDDRNGGRLACIGGGQGRSAGQQVRRVHPVLSLRTAQVSLRCPCASVHRGRPSDRCRRPQRP